VGPALSLAALFLAADGGAIWPDNVTLAPPGKTAAKDSDWWAIRSLTRPPLPVVKDKTWVRNPIDQFILATLDGKGLQPSEEADRVTFIRRATYDLHGLPPTPEEIDAFVNDLAPDAFEKLIDRLLASARYGERWGRHWLDIAHYADTHGFDKDKRRWWAWLFRDWVIRAFNRDMPYRRFVRSQLAGDVLFPDDPDGIIATGFISAGPWDFVGQVELGEGTIEKEKTRNLDRDDMVANTMSTFVSLTTHCARCHDHKFDPISQKEYYRLQAVFAGVDRGDRPVSKSALAHVRAAFEELQVRNRQARELLLKKYVKSADADRWTKLLGFLDDLSEARDKLAELPAAPALKKSPSNGYHSAISARPDSMQWVQVDLSESRFIDEIVLVPARPVDFPDTPGFGFPVRFHLDLSDDADFKKAARIADHTDEDYPNPGDVPVIFRVGKKARYARVTAEILWKRTNDYAFALAELQVFSGGKNLALGAKVTAEDSIESGLWSKKYLVDNFDSRREIPDRGNVQTRTRFELEQHIQQLERKRAALLEYFRYPGSKTESPFVKLDREMMEVAEKIRQLKDVAKVYAVLPRVPRPIHLLKRGDVERKGELLGPGALSLLPGFADRLQTGPQGEFKLANPGDEGSRRVALADWICDSNNVLTWRSIANRLWQYHFGRGLVDTPNDFGKNGSRPTHPELLDWLAVEFRDGGESFKKMHRLIMLSAVYRQSSKHHADFAKIDGDNRYLWRMNRQRLDAESIRDSVLAVSGKLNLRMYGPGFDLFRFKDDHSPIYDHTDLARNDDPTTFRRTVYRFVVRSVPNPFLDSFDCADANINVPVRNATLTALQALALLNNPFIIKQAEFFAERLQTVSPDDVPRQIDSAYRLALGRLPTAEERMAMVGYARRHGLANACRVLLNTNEFLFVD